MMRAIALVDLDDTLFQTRGKCPSDVADGRLRPLGFKQDGEPLSFATPRQMSFIEWLTDTTLFVPVTARSLDALRRVRIPFGAAVCAHGGVILDDGGTVDAQWAAAMSGKAAGHAAELEGFASAILAGSRRTAAPINARVLTEDGMSLYVLAKDAEGDAERLNRVVNEAVPSLPPGWTDHRNGNNVALMPPYLGKQHAVRHLLATLRDRHPDLPVLGIGDSLTDAPFMASCDFAIMPTGSQLARELLRGG